MQTHEGHDVQSYAAESRAKFLELVHALAEEHHRLCSFTQDLVGGGAMSGEEGFNSIARLSPPVSARKEAVPVTHSHGGKKASQSKPTTPIALTDCKSFTPKPRAHSIPTTPSDSENDEKCEEAPMLGESEGLESQAFNKEMTIQSSPSAAHRPQIRISRASRDSHQSAYSRSSTLDRVHPSILYRLQARLGVLNWRSPISAELVLKAARSLGLEKYKADDLRKLIARMVDASGSDPYLEMESAPKQFRKKALAGLGRTASALHLKRSASMLTGGDGDFIEKCIPCKNFAEYLVSEVARAKLGPEYEEMCTTLKEVLLSGDANRLVAELTSVRVDDLATPQPMLDWDMLFEPMIGVVILLNGVCIGIQTDDNWETWKGWAWIEATFTLFFLMEMLIRIGCHGIVLYYTGPDRAWAFLDTCIVLMGLVDFVLFISDEDIGVGALTIIRTCRMLRITRLFRIFRLSFLRELNIMVKGLLAGMRTLAWAIVLLFFTIYLIAVLATYTLGKSSKDQVIAEEELFASVPRSMLTCFRCFVGDCTTSEGAAIVKHMSDAHGVLFVFGYLCSFIIVTLGLFNLIMALYVEITMEAAKRNEEHDKKRQQRESMRIARTTKKLLKKFCVAQLFADPRKTKQAELSRILKESDDMDLESDLTVSKELFLLIVQDQEVQSLMNELDIPPDRANLFEVLDADGTGDLHVTELVHGFLKVRGEARKSDLVASLLAVRAVQDMLRLMEKKVLANQKRMMDKLGIKRKNREASIWDNNASNATNSKRVSMTSSLATTGTTQTPVKEIVVESPPKTGNSTEFGPK